jgi:hypothetical protein
MGDLSAQYRNRHRTGSRTAHCECLQPMIAAIRDRSCGCHRLLALRAGRDRRTRPDRSGQLQAKIWEEFLVKSQTLTLVILPMSRVRPHLRLVLEVPIEATCGRPPLL